MSDISVQLVEDEETVLEIAPLRQSHTSEAIGKQISYERALDKVIELYDRGSDFWIATDGNTPIGYAVGTITGDSYISDGVYVQRRYRGREIGVDLLKAQIEFARSLGCKHIISNVHEENIPSIRAATKAGFEFESSDAGYIVKIVFEK